MRTTTRLLCEVLLALLAVPGAVACSANAGGGNNPDAPPSGCQRTLCDFKHDYCQNPSQQDPCSACFDECSSMDPSMAADCVSTCDGICQSESSQPTSDPCGDALTACRKTTDNALCVDDIASRGPDGAPCNDTASEVACVSAAEKDYGGLGHVYTMNPACQQCDDGWKEACYSAVCQDQLTKYVTCVTQGSCADSADCPSCDEALQEWTSCLYAAEADPSDPSGCYSGSHRCWTKPICRPDGTASQ